MPPYAVRVRTSTGWQDIALVGPAGAKGDPGPWRGAWAAGTAYAVGDAVSYASGGVTATYRRKVAGTTAGVPSTDTTNWELVASGGSVGGAGPTGPAGAPGGQAVTFLVGDGSATSFTCIHNLATRNVTVSVFRSASPYDEIEADVERTDVNTVTVRSFPTVPAIGEYTVAVSAPGQQATLNITMDGWHIVGAAGEPAFQGGWQNYDAAPAIRPARFRKFPDGRVALGGLIKGGAAGAVEITLPLGYRPAPGRHAGVPVVASGGPAEVDVMDSGNVIVYTMGGAVNAYTYLDGVEFDTESVLQTASVAAQPLDAWHLIGAAGEPGFLNSWLAYGGPGYTTPGFRKFPDGRVRLKGGLRSGVLAQPAFVLPVGYRPAQPHRIIVYGQTTGPTVPCLLYIDTSGNVHPYSGTNTEFDIDGVEFDTESVSAYTTGVLGPPRVTALPTSPIDGQECYLVADAANGVIWHLRYNAASASAYKWEVVGGSPLAVEAAAAYETTSSGTYVALATAGPSITLPVAGDWVISQGFEGYIDTTGSAWGTYMSYDIGATAAVDADNVVVGGAPQQSGAGQPMAFRARRKNGLGAVALVSKYKVYPGGTIGHFQKRSMSAMPIRVG
jgi:hypothetical protein